MADSADKKLDRLFAAARAEQADTSALEAHFETRLMARIAERKALNTPWYMLAWRMVPAFAVIALISAVCSAAFSPSRSGDLFASITNGYEDVVATSYLAGE